MKPKLSITRRLADSLTELHATWRSSLQPLTARFLANDLPAQAFYDAVRPTYERALTVFDSALSAELGRSHSADNGIADNPDSSASTSAAIDLYPVSITGHNLVRLLHVLIADTDGGLASEGALAERLLDLDVTVEQIGNLLTAKIQKIEQGESND